MLKPLIVLLLAWAATPSADRLTAPAAGDLVTDAFGVTIVRDHLAAAPVVTTDAVEVLPPVYSADHDRNAAWRSLLAKQYEAYEGAVPQAQPRRVQPAPPWTYTPDDQTYTPKTDWTYHPRVRPYTPKPTSAFAYTPKHDWTYTPTHFHQWP
ncbi:MAG TPA: hypothetical protein P5572_09240 [Phycisphaerae bacterium]|nr:hypothetical protein [Phycisphaerae bacterium]